MYRNPGSNTSTYRKASFTFINVLNAHYVLGIVKVRTETTIESFDRRLYSTVVQMTFPLLNIFLSHKAKPM